MDTVRLLVRAGPTADQLEAYWDWYLTQRPSGVTNCKYYYNPTDESDKTDTLPRFTYHPSSFLGTKQISIEVSLPKLIFGNNYELLSEVGPALDRLDEIIDADPALPPLPSMADASLSRLDTPIPARTALPVRFPWAPPIAQAPHRYSNYCQIPQWYGYSILGNMNTPGGSGRLSIEAENH